MAECYPLLLKVWKNTDAIFDRNVLFFRFDDCVEGGESTVVDTVPVIEELRQKHPKYFKVLSRVPYTATMEHDSLDGQSV